MPCREPQFSCGGTRSATGKLPARSPMKTEEQITRFIESELLEGAAPNG